MNGKFAQTSGKAFVKLRRLLAPMLTQFSIPFIFFGTIFTYQFIDHYLAKQEVTVFLNQHVHLVPLRMQNPKVHRFELQRDPENSGRVLITFDVEDKETYYLLEDDLSAVHGLRNPPRWKTVLRSRENLGGFDVSGMGEAAEAITLFWGAMFLSVTLPVLFWTVVGLNYVVRNFPAVVATLKADLRR